MEQRRQSQTCLSYAESRQRKSIGKMLKWMRGRREGDYLLKNRNLPLCRLFCHFSYRKPPFSPAKLAIFIFKSSLFLSFFFPDGSTGKRLLTICNLSFRPEIPPLFFLHKACFREEHTKNMLKEKRIMLGEKRFFPSRAGRMKKEKIPAHRIQIYGWAFAR